jgi:aldehyde:ferredoxin oxidoreductase
MSGRLAVATRSPLTGTVTDSHIGGWTAAKLKWAGFDGLIFEGKSPEPVYAYLEVGKLELRNADDLWGKNIHETVETLQERHGDDVTVMAIGRAGENLVRFAGFINEDDRAAGRGGTGAVAGSKNLKAIVARGDRANMPQPADPEAFDEVFDEVREAIMESDVTAPGEGGLSVYGTNVLMNLANEISALPTANSKTTEYEHADDIGGEAVRESILVGEPACHNCPVACKKEVEVKEGKYKVHMESVEYESAWSLGANCLLGSPEAISYLIDVCNDYGLDTIEVGNALSMTMEASERGLIDEDIPWGDADRMIALLKKIGDREGLGDTLAEGTGRAAEAFGDRDLAMVVKNQAIPAYDPRGMQGIGLGYATSNRGACHLRGYTPSSEVMGLPEPTDPLEWEGKAELLIAFQDLHAVSDSFDICKFSAFAEDAELYLKQYQAVTGIDLTMDEMMQAGERIYNLERHYNNLVGFDGDDDTLPRRFLEEPAVGAAEGSVSHLDEMLEEYYELRDWEAGVVPEWKRQELGIV